MKILHLLYSGLGGHGNVFFSLVTADKRHEYEYEALFNGIEDVKQGYIKNCDALDIKWKYVKKKPGFDYRYYKNIVGIVKKSDAGIIFLHSSAYILPVIMANVLSNKKKKIIIRETQSNNLKTRVEWLWLFMAFLTADKIVFLSEEYKKEIRKKLHWIYRNTKVAVIPNGIDLSLFKPGINTKEGPVVIGMQSRLTENKDHITLLHAFATLKQEGYNIKLKIAGDGVCKHELIKLSQRLTIANFVEFTGMLEEKELVEFLQEIHIYVHASMGETMSTALMQAMACRLPIIASDVDGINNMIIDNKTGILVPLKDHIKMADSIKDLLRNNLYAKELADNAYCFAQINYAGSTMFNRYCKIFTGK